MCSPKNVRSSEDAAAVGHRPGEDMGCGFIFDPHSVSFPQVVLCLLQSECGVTVSPLVSMCGSLDDGMSVHNQYLP